MQHQSPLTPSPRQTRYHTAASLAHRGLSVLVRSQHCLLMQLLIFYLSTVREEMAYCVRDMNHRRRQARSETCATYYAVRGSSAQGLLPASRRLAKPMPSWPHAPPLFSTRHPWIMDHASRPFSAEGAKENKTKTLCPAFTTDESIQIPSRPPVCGGSFTHRPCPPTVAEVKGMNRS